MQSSRTSRGVRAVALAEAIKGALVLVAGFGLLSLVHHDVRALAEHLVGWLHLDPHKKYPALFLDAASRVTDARLVGVAALALCYAVMREIEAYGLWHERRWAEWFALVSGGIYLPIEIYELLHHATWMKGLALAINLVIVAYMGFVIWRNSHSHESHGPSG
jgi:uncharacterized membrane protein (DUF2068 family)